MVQSSYYRKPSLGKKGNKPSEFTFHKSKGYVSQDTVIKLLEDTKDVDPIAAYKLAFHYLANDDNKKAIKLFTYAAQNNVKEAQYELSRLYSNPEIIDTDLEKSVYWNDLYQDKSDNFIKRIYGN